jgi:2-polyprenyl-3-methyl-5-hydroxy-6-metoxy-1,4-benzoquinol methylase
MQSESELRENKPCLLCGNHDARVAYDFPSDYYDRDHYETASWDGRLGLPLRIVRCPHCDLLYASPSFKADALGHVYPEDLVSASITFERALAQSRSKHTWLLRQLRTHLQSGSVCDIGSRYGVLPHLARQAGYDAFGIEYNAAAVRVATNAGVPVFQGSTEDLPRVLRECNRSHVDAFVLDDVLEHLVDPAAALRALSESQHAGGWLFLQQMDVDSLGHKLFRRHWYYLQPAAHMYYFRERTLRALLQRFGYDVVRIVRPALLRNLRRTLTRTWPGAALKFVRSRFARGGKPSYLTQRLRSADDMFLVIAQKR